MPLPALDPSSDDVARHHVLVLPPDVGPDEIETLAISRFARAVWEVQPSAVPPRASGGARGLRMTVAPPGVLRVSRHSTVEGPFTLDRSANTTLGVPTSAGVAYVLRAPVERGPRPWPGGGDRDGLARAFPEGLPVRDEERVVKWLVDVARRLGGAVRVAPNQEGNPTVLVPDPAAAVDLTVWTDLWLDPDAALTVIRQAVPRARLNLPDGTWSGPPAGIGQRPVPGTEDMDEAARTALHAAADEYDLRALTEPEPMRGFGALVDLDMDGIIAVEVAGETVLPPVIADLPWAEQGAIGYTVHWEPPDVADMEDERPSLAHKVARGRSTPLVVAIARALHKSVGGEITDMMGFIVDPADL
ncbi:hypothetical protein [Cellulomonas bogoriensis]|uniref:PRTRC system protein E n=1 Tax=Cellulomonas bogoriensis 69B4 = DSM 16987 TaxID=1386082 RepID=A0A0A0BYF2_9CELL|nr:hypothetical protein [Cellulomonas bogoriensis]KGM13428.1 hypothetical protein N869_14270 [Cellulomonas bogoriensis 69B4 = DSM 16987]